MVTPPSRRAPCTVPLRRIIKYARGDYGLAAFTLRIEGMHCGSCIRRVSQALAAAPAVRVEEVRLGAARLSSDSDPLPIDSALAALRKAGYTAHLES